MDENKVKYYPYDESSEGDEKSQEGYSDNRNGGAGKGSDRSVKTLIGILIAVLLVLVILLGVFVALKKKDKNQPANSGNIATASDVVTTTEVAVTTEADLYPVGDYIVSAEGSLRLREDHSTEAKHIMSVPSGTKLTITEIYIDDNAATPEEKFWGKTDYKGWAAWVAMSYLSKAAESGTEVTTLEGESGAAVVTTLPGETTTKSASSAKYEVGKYVVTADEFLRVREDHDVDSEAFTQIDHGEEITVLEIYHDEETDDPTLEYWGKISYEGEIGWVAMHYTEPAA